MLAWQHSDAIDLICTDKWNETPDTISFSLASINRDTLFDFKPGQFVTLGFSLSDKTVYRAYSISSLPMHNQLKMTVKRVNKGLVSNYIVDQLAVGDQVTALKPAGSFNSIDCAPSKKVLMLSAGCGITPVISMVKQWLSNNIDIDIDFIHQAKNTENTIYFSELEAIAQQHKNFHLKLLLKDSKGSSYQQGRFDQQWLEKLCPDVLQRTVYLCGPVGFMQDARCYLEQLDFDMTQFFEESFTPEAKNVVPENEPYALDTELINSSKLVTGSVSVSVPTFAAQVDVEVDSILIDALEQAGVPVIAACRSGICGSCKCKVKVGEVERTSTETLTDQEVDQGFVLACSCKIKSDLEISLN
ncbi:2Fe-2S iron-sulfur cluster-binding protein [Vibrio sp. MA40-2]|uniref:2Fe-2S iron-sulfur cluster-binding protein n=1 Tax=Vibrio sp. MA40-2 TaxID=3391828 RepID=UPI0039A6454C